MPEPTADADADADADAIERRVRVRAPVEHVFAHFTDPDLMKQWQGVLVELDPQPGGKYWVNVTGRDILSGEFREILPNQRIVLAWGWETPGHPIRPGSTTAEITFSHESGVTTVLVRHTGVPKADHLNTASGWQHYLTRLGMVASGRDPGPDPWVSAP